MALVGLERILEPPLAAVSITELARQVRLDDDTANADYERLVGAATAAVEGVLRRSLLTQTWVFSLDCFPVQRWILLPRGPLQSVSAVRYLDADGAQQTWAASGNYGVTTRSDRLYLLNSASWPTTASLPSAVEIEYIAGYGGSRESVPQEFRHALLLLTAHYFDNPAAGAAPSPEEIPFGVKWLLAPRALPADVAPY